MKWLRLAVLGNVIWLVACATAPRAIDGECVVMEDSRLEGQFVLEVTQGQQNQQLLVVNQWHQQQLQLIGFNAVGAKLFNGQLHGNQIVVDTSRLYRGPAAEFLLWALVLHQLREQLPNCWSSVTVQVGPGDPPQQVRLRDGGKPIFSSNAATGYALPAEGIEVRVRQL